jgi:hypothetical protein
MKSLLVGTGRCLCKLYNYYDSRACGYRWSLILFHLDGLGMKWLGYGFCLAVWSCVIYRIPLWITMCGIFLIQLNWVVLEYNLNIRRQVVINDEWSIGAFLLTALLPHWSCYYPCISFYSCTCLVPTISVLNLAIFPYHTNLLLRRWWWRMGWLSYLVFMPKPSTHRMHDPGSIVPHIRPKVFTDNQMS